MRDDNQTIFTGIGAGQLSQSLLSAGPYRDKAQTFVENQRKRHATQEAAWRWIGAAMVCHPPSDEEEAALWELLSSRY